MPDDCGITTTENEDGDTFTLRIDNLTYKRRGKYTCKADGVETAGYLDFDGKNYLFIWAVHQKISRTPNFVANKLLTNQIVLKKNQACKKQQIFVKIWNSVLETREAMRWAT